MMKELRLLPRDGLWCVEHLQDDYPDPEISDLWDGETVLPTPWFSHYPVQAVVAELAKRNPEKKVTIHGTALPYIYGLTCDRCGRGFNVPVAWKFEYCGNPTDEVLCVRCRTAS